MSSRFFLYYSVGHNDARIWSEHHILKDISHNDFAHYEVLVIKGISQNDIFHYFNCDEMFFMMIHIKR